MDADEALSRWVEERPKYKAYAKRIKTIVGVIAHRNGMSVTTSARAKDVASYRSKLILRGYPDAWDGVTDKAGVRAVVATHEDVDTLVEFLQGAPELRVLCVDDKRQYDPPDSLSYSGVHVQVQADHDGEPLECEIQVKTIAQHAWSVVSHSLVYKAALELPKAEKHAVYRLVALVELFDEEVTRVTRVLPKLPGYERLPLIEAAEGHFERFAHARGNRELTVMVLDSLGAVVPDTPEYIDELGSFVDSESATIVDAVATYGPSSQIGTSHAYALFSQPELLIVLELLRSNPVDLQSAWMQSELPDEWLRMVATCSDADVGLLG